MIVCLNVIMFVLGWEVVLLELVWVVVNFVEVIVFKGMYVIVVMVDSVICWEKCFGFMVYN